MPLRRSAAAVKRKIEEAQAEALSRGIPADRLINQAPPRTLPPAGNTGQGYTPDPDAVTRIDVRKNSAGSVFSRRRLNLIEGSGVLLTVADDSGSEEVDITIAASGGTGTVTSVALTAPSEIGVAGSPITTAGTIALTWANASANRVFAGPTTGGAATPAFRTLVAGDIPDISATYQPLDSDLTAIAALSSTGLAARTAANTWAQRTITGTVNRVTVTNGDGVSGNPTLDIASTYAGQTSITTLGTVTSGTWTAVPISVPNGGNGFVAYTVGDILYASTTTAFTKLNAVATGNALISGGVGAAPSWGKIDLTTHLTGVLPAANGGTGQSSYAVGDLLYASGSTALSKLADVATGNALISGGVTTAPSWGKIALTTHVSGILPSANGGTGINNGTNDLTVPATGTAALREIANTFAAAQTFEITDAGTTTSPSALLLRHRSSGVPATNFGVTFGFEAETSTNANRNLGQMTVRWATATDASRKAQYIFFVSDSGGIRSALTLEASGTAAMIGFLGAAAVVRPTVSGSRGANAALASALTALANLGLITDSSTV